MIKNIFFIYFLGFFSKNLIAFPHTSGRETYTKDFYKNKTLRFKKNFQL